MRNKPQTIRLLTDKPADASAFKSHGDIASVIKELITNGTGDESIGLLGPWGSGKSSIIKILDSKLEADKSQKYMLFVFDTWLHGEDPLRRSFIEQLIDFYHSKGMIKKDADTPQKILAEVSKRQKDLTITETPKVSPAAILAVASYLFSTALASHLLDNIDKITVPFWITYLLVTFAYIWPIGFLFFKKTRNLSAFTVDQIEKEVKQTVINTPDPTTLEFQKYFCEIINQVVDTHKLVIVLDNLDRVSDEDALKMFSVMRSFFSNNKPKNISVIVPLDEASLERILGSSMDVDAFIEKSFSAKFYVSPPILTDNKKFFLTQLEEILPNAGDLSDKEAIFSIYDRHSSKSDNTPRKLKNFLNDLAILYQLWGNKIDIKTIALYALVQSKLKDSNTLRSLSNTDGNSNLISAYQVHLADNTKIATDFAAMYYGVDQEQALHVLFGNQLLKGLEEGLADQDFIGFASLHGFREVMSKEFIPQISRFTNDGTILANTAYSLHHLEEKSDISFVWTALAKRLDIKHWTDLNSKTVDGLRILISKVPEGHMFRLLKDILKSISFTTEAFKAQPWVEILNMVNNSLEQSKQEQTLLEYTNQDKNNISAHLLISAILYANEKVYSSLREYFFSLLQTEKHKSSLSHLVSQPGNSKSLFTILNYLKDSPLKNPKTFEYLVHQSFSMVLNHTDMQEIEYSFLSLELLHSSYSAHDAQSKLQELYNNGVIYAHLGRARDANNISLISLIISLATKYHFGQINPQRSYPNRNYQAGYQVREAILTSDPVTEDPILELIADNVIRFKCLDNISARAATQPQYLRFYSKLLNKVVEKGCFADSMNSQYLIANYPSYRDLIDPKLIPQLILQMLDRSDLISSILAAPFTAQPARFYRDVFTQETEIAHKIAEHARQRYSTLSTEEWQAAFTSWHLPEGLLQSLMYLKATNKPPILGPNAVDAVLDNLEVLSGYNNDIEKSALLSSLPGMFPNNEKKLFTSRLLIKLIALGKQERTEALGIIFSWYKDFLPALSKPSFGESIQEFIDYVIIPLISRKSENILIWLEQHASKLITLLNADQKQQLLSRLDSSLTTSDESYKRSVTKVISEFKP